MRRPVTGSCNFATLDSQWQHLSVLEYFYNRVDSIERMKESRSVVPDSLQLHGLYSPWNSPGQNTWVGSLSLLQGIFPTQGSNPGLLHCRWILSQLSHQRSPRILEWVAYLFSSGSSWPRNRTGSPALQTDSLWTELSGKPIERLVYFKFYRKLGDHLEFSSHRCLPPGYLHHFSREGMLWGAYEIMLNKESMSWDDPKGYTFSISHSWNKGSWTLWSTSNRSNGYSEEIAYDGTRTLILMESTAAMNTVHISTSNGNPLQYSCLENLLDRTAWQATVYGVTESDTT